MTKMHPLATQPTDKAPLNYFYQMNFAMKALSVLLFPFKFVLMFACICGAGIAAMIIQGNSDPARPLSKRRFRHYHDGCTTTGKLILFFHGLLFKQYGKRDPKADVLCANHQFYLDAAVIAAACGGSAVAASGMAQMWYLKSILKLSRAIIVLRGRPEDKKIAKEFGIDESHKCRDIMQHRIRENREYDAGRGAANTQETRWPQTIIFPEGIITNHQSLLRFRTSCFSLDGVRIQPYYIRYRTVLKLEWLTQSGIKAMFRAFLNPWGVCELHWLDVIEKAENETVEKFTERARHMIAKAGDLMKCDYTNEDMFYYIGWCDISRCSEAYRYDFGYLGYIGDARAIHGPKYELHQDDIRELEYDISKTRENCDAHIKCKTTNQYPDLAYSKEGIRARED